MWPYIFQRIPYSFCFFLFLFGFYSPSLTPLDSRKFLGHLGAWHERSVLFFFLFRYYHIYRRLKSSLYDHIWKPDNVTVPKKEKKLTTLIGNLLNKIFSERPEPNLFAFLKLLKILGSIKKKPKRKDCIKNQLLRFLTLEMRGIFLNDQIFIDLNWWSIGGTISRNWVKCSGRFVKLRNICQR